MMQNDEISKLVSDGTSKVVMHNWQTRAAQRKKQETKGNLDQGLRSAVTGGAQMDGFIDLFTDIVRRAEIPETCVFRKKAVELPGFFRPTKEWDMLIVRDKKLIAAIEAKSQVGPSFGNNFNNRVEEAIGSALDLWTAFREKAYLESPQPFLGYVFLLEDCSASNRPVGVQEPHFKVFPEFANVSYMRRYKLFCRKLILERHYTAAAFITCSAEEGLRGIYKTPSDDLSMERFVKTFLVHLSAFR